MSERTEKVKFSFLVNKEQIAAHHDGLEALLDNHVVPSLDYPGELLNVNVEVKIDYYDMVERLRALLTILDSGIVIHASQEELLHGESLLLTLTEQVRRVREKTI